MLYMYIYVLIWPLQECIDQWLSSRRPLCPVCKHNALKDSSALTEQVSAAVRSVCAAPKMGTASGGQ